MKFSARDLIWLFVVLVISAGWLADHLRLKFELAMNDWAWQMHPGGGQRVIINGEESAIPIRPAQPPPGFFTEEQTEAKNQRPFSFIGRPISGADIDPVGTDFKSDSFR